MELDITWKRATKVWWAYLWRNIVAIIAAVIIGAIIGAIFGFILGMLGSSQETIQVVVAPIGFIIGIGISIVPIKMILGKNFGEFRLVLIENSPAENT
jgi:Na+/citrate or Na+/malate symporter